MTTHNDSASVGPVSVPLSALEHVDYCHRQAALIHIEATWSENLDTVRGDLAHHAVDLPVVRRRRGTTVIRSLPVYSWLHGLHGVCDLTWSTSAHHARSTREAPSSSRNPKSARHSTGIPKRHSPYKCLKALTNHDGGTIPRRQ